MKAQEQIRNLQKSMNYPTCQEYKIRPLWQVDVSKYGGLREYKRIVKLYWRLANMRNNGENPLNFPLMEKPDVHYKLLQFREDINAVIYEYDI